MSFSLATLIPVLESRAVPIVRLTTAAVLPVFVLPSVDCFTSQRNGPRLTATGRGLQQRASATPIMSYADKLREARAAKKAARARRTHSSSVPAVSPAPAAAVAGSGTMDSQSPFSEEMLETIRTAIAILTMRLQRDKPVTRSEFERFESAVAVIVEDALPNQELPSQAIPPPPSSSRVSTPPWAEPTATADGGSVLDDEDISEGPGWDPKGGYGLPRGVRNSYVIDDMGKMDPEEYQAALRRKVIARAQSARKTGSYGNIAAKDYIAFLGKNPKSGDEVFESHKKAVEERHSEDFGRY